MNKQETLQDKLARKSQERASQEQQLVTQSSLPRHAMFNKSLIIDARMSSRRKLVEDLGGTGLFQSTQQANSLEDGISSLKNEHWDACIIGPSLTKEGVERFVAKGREVVQSVDCAFVAVVHEHSFDGSEEFFKSIGIHSVIGTNYSRRSFSDVVCSAIRNAHANPISRSEQKISRSVPDLLSDSATQLRTLAQAIDKGVLDVKADGTPTPEINKALSSIFTKLLPEAKTRNDHYSDDRFFVSAILDWFTKRTKTNHGVATENLRRSLIANIYRNNKVLFKDISAVDSPKAVHH